MDVLLFDVHDSGHHLEYVSNLTAELRSLDSEISIEFLTSGTIDDPGNELSEVPTINLDNLCEGRNPTVVDLVQRAEAYADSSGVDLLHFLQIDDIVAEVYAATRDRRPRVPFLASINGAFFRNSKYVRYVRSVAGLPVVGRLVMGGYEAAPGLATRRLHSLPRRTLGLTAAVRSNIFKRIFVHTAEARQFLASIKDETSTSIVPDPTPLWFQDGIDRMGARSELGLPPDERVFLFFGELRDDKGIELLLDALKRYDGPRFVMAIAGSPGQVEGAELDRSAFGDGVELHRRLEFIPNWDVPRYFRAADAVVCPYRPMFGRERTSGVFQRACGSCRPVIVPDFGVLGRRTRDHDLGQVFEPNDPASLARVLEDGVRDGISFDETSMRAYALEQSFPKLAADVFETYRRVVG